MFKKQFTFLLAFLGWLQPVLHGQPSPDLEAFAKMNSEERCVYIRQMNLGKQGAEQFKQYHKSLSEIAQKDKDGRTQFILDLEQYQARLLFKWPKEEAIKRAEGLATLAQKIGWDEGALVGNHYLTFEQYDQNLLTNEQLYASIIKEFEQIQEQGLANFKLFDLGRILQHSARFMYQLEDFEKTLKILQVAEQCAVANDRGLQQWALIINLIESIYQQQGDYDKGIAYAKKLLAQMENCPSTWDEQLKLCKVWQGIASIDIADMLVKKGNAAEGEVYADKGYKAVSEGTDKQAEFDALLVLAPTKLKLGKTEEAYQFLRRMDELLAKAENKNYYYFKRIRLYETYAEYFEKKGNLNEAYRYTNLAKPLQDSLDRKNDARKFEKIQQRLEAEKYTQQLELVESEKQLQKMLRNAAIVIMILMGGLAYGNYKRLQHKRKQAAAELEAARSELEIFTQHLREKSEMNEKLRSELERQSKSGERSEYLEKLTKSTILTDEDWSQFRSIFEKVHPNFIETQKTQYPDLTQAELRYLVLEKLQLTTHEMANMLGVSDGTIRQTRMRMKRKIGDGK